MFVVAVSSVSKIKVDAVSEVFEKYANENGVKLELLTISTKDAPIPEQPINNGGECAMLRNEYMKKTLEDKKWDLLISIENSILIDHDEFPGYIDSDISKNEIQDMCDVIIEDNRKNIYFGSWEGGRADKKYFDQAYELTDKNYPYGGLEYTIGAMIHKEYPDIDSQNWIGEKRLHPKNKYNRIDQIKWTLKMAFSNNNINDELYKAVIRAPDFPKPGVIFQDLSNILLNPDLMEKLIDAMMDVVNEHYASQNLKIKIIGLDARGFIYGSLLARACHLPFIMARKKGKLPRKTIEMKYGTEYSNDCIEIMEGLINKDDHVIIVDDLIATGGSLKAAADLIKIAGGTPLACITILQVPELLTKAKEKLGDLPIHVMIK